MIMVATFDEFINENESPRKYGCLMLSFDDTNWKEEIISIIDPEDLYTEDDDYGFEFEPHCTVLYGFHDDQFSMDKCMKMLVPASSIPLSCTRMSTFNNEKFDVLKYDIESEVLDELNKQFASSFKHTNKFPEYHAHCTIAYLKPGTGEKYVKDIEKKFTASKYKFGYGNGDKVYITKQES